MRVIAVDAVASSALPPSQPPSGIQPLHQLAAALPPPRPAEQLHEMCDAEMVPDSGQRQWASTLRQFGGEYDAIAQLAHAHEAQCLQIMGQDHIVGDEDEWDDD